MISCPRPRVRRVIPSLTPMVLIVLALLLGGIPLHADDTATSPDSLWQKAVALAGANAGWVPGLLETRTEELDKHGEPEKVHRSQIRLFLNEEGIVDSEILLAYEDEKDITEKEREDAAERKAKRKEEEEKRRKKALEESGEEPQVSAQGSGARFGNTTPFDPGVQDSVTVRRTHAEDPPPGGPFVAFAYDRTERDGTISRGIAWLDAVTGVPREIRHTPDPLPKHVKTLEITVHFDQQPDGAWVTSRMTVRAIGKFLFFTKRIRNEMTFSNHWWMEEEARGASSEVEVR